MMSKISPRLLLVALLIACAGPQLLAQPETESSPDTTTSLDIKKTVRRVIVDVVVTDSTGKPVRGLSAPDFSVTEDSNPQKVLSFDVHDLESASGFAKLPPLPLNTFANIPAAPERGPLYVILLDLLNMETDDQPIARQQLLKFISDKPAGTRFAIFCLSDGLHLIQGFTDDQTQLLAALSTSGPGRHIPRIFLQADNYRPYISLLGTLMDIARFLDGLPGRKNVIWMSGSFPSSILPSADPAAEAVDYSEEIKQATAVMARGQIAVYPINVRGVVVTSVPGSAGINRGSSSVADPNDQGAGSGSGGAASANAPITELNGIYMTEEQIARATGGHAFYSTNDLKGALTEATEIGANYYTLTYSPSNPKYDGKLRKIHVELSGRGYHLAYRRSYYSEDPDTLTRQLSILPDAGSLFANMKHGAPVAHQISLKAHLRAMGPPAKATPEQMLNLAVQTAYFQARRKKRITEPPRPIELQTYAIDYTVMVNPSDTGEQADAAKSLTLQFATAVFDGEGRVLNGKVQSAIGVSSPVPLEASQQGTYRVQQKIDVPVDAASIRIAVRDASSDRIGALEVALPLPSEPRAEATEPEPAKPN
jgi:VWFA-related protein